MSTETLWGVGTFTTTDGAVPFPVSDADMAGDTASAGRVLDGLGIGRGDRVLVVGLVSECAQLVPFHEALRLRGAILSGADATPFDAPRTAKLARQLAVRAVLGVNGAVVDGLLAEGFDLAEVFGPVPLVAARPDAVGRLRAAGVAATVWAHVGPAVAVECRPGAGAHVDTSVWAVTTDAGTTGAGTTGAGTTGAGTTGAGTVVVTARAARALPSVAYDTGTTAILDRAPCGCGRSDVRLVGLGSPR